MLQSPNRSRRILSALALVVALVVCARPPQPSPRTGIATRTATAHSPMRSRLSSIQYKIPGLISGRRTFRRFPSFQSSGLCRTPSSPLRDGGHDTVFTSWERRRNEIMAAVEKYEIGEEPDCHDCTITANYVPPASGSSNGTLTVNVTIATGRRSL